MKSVSVGAHQQSLGLITSSCCLNTAPCLTERSLCHKRAIIPTFREQLGPAFESTAFCDNCVEIHSSTVRAGKCIKCHRRPLTRSLDSKSPNLQSYVTAVPRIQCSLVGEGAATDRPSVCLSAPAPAALTQRKSMPHGF